jgi:hypothetical protein
MTRTSCFPHSRESRSATSTLQDVSSKSYDRWNYMPEKRDGMEKWNKFVTALLTKKPLKIAACASPSAEVDAR